MQSRNTKKVCVALVIFFIIMQSMIILPSIVLANENSDMPKITYNAHLKNSGWDKTYKNASNEQALKVQTPSTKDIVGTVGEARRMEALEINIDAPKGVTIKYRAHVRNYGWMSWVTADNKVNTNFVGTTGEAKRMEALQIVAEGPEDYDIKYRAHVEDYGWLSWITAGKSIDTATTQKGTYAGTTGEAKRIEAIQIVIVKTEDAKNRDKLQQEHTHQYTQWETINAPTCTKLGLEKRVCKVCGKVETQTMQALHSLKESMIRAEEKDVNATCTRRGQEHYVCKYCGDDFFNLTPALGHEWSEEFIVDKEATCAENGVKSIHCTREGCMEKRNEQVISATGHNWIETHQDITCTQDKMIINTCENCGEVKTQVLEKASGHSFGEYTYNNDATCTKDGTETAHCSYCDVEDVRVKIGSKKQHELVKNDDGKEATCTENGLTASKRCLHCNYVEAQTEIPAGHKWEEKYTETTCTGCKLSYVCKVCGETKPEQTVKMGTGHKWSADETKCETCGMKAPIDINYIYFVNYFVNPNEAEPFENGVYELREGRRRDDKMNEGEGSCIKIEAPKAKSGYKFKEWINAVTGEVITQDTTIVSRWKDMDKYFKPVYEKVEE